MTELDITKPMQTRDGEWTAKWLFDCGINTLSEARWFALTNKQSGTMYASSRYEGGELDIGKSHPRDIINTPPEPPKPVVEKKVQWANVYPDFCVRKANLAACHSDRGNSCIAVARVESTKTTTGKHVRIEEVTEWTEGDFREGE